MWPPTNALVPDGMMAPLIDANTPTGADGEYIIDNFLGSEYRIIALATTFPDGYSSYVPWTSGPIQDWQGGTGSWMVNYHQVSTTFWRLVERYTPVAVLSFTRNDPDKKWVFETVVRNDSNNNATSGHNGDRWLEITPYSGLPYIGGAANDPAAEVGRPNHGNNPITDNPPDTTIPACTSDSGSVGTRSVPQATLDLMAAIATALSAQISSSDLTTAYSEMGKVTYPEQDNFVSAFVGYHGLWYQAFKPSTCVYAFHTHVGFSLDLAVCQLALCIQLKATVEALGGTCTQGCV